MIPLHTTRIKVVRYSPTDPGNQDPYEPKQPPSPTVNLVVAQGVRANIASPSGSEELAGGSQEVVRFSLSCDPVDLKHTDQVVDETTAAVYEVVWARQRTGIDHGLDHTRASLKQVTGIA